MCTCMHIYIYLHIILDIVKKYIYIHTYIYFLGSAGDQTQNLMHARQAL